MTLRTAPCLPCEWLRRLARMLSYLLLPRVFALVCALGILGLMAPSSAPVPRLPKKAVDAAASAAAAASAVAGAAGSIATKVAAVAASASAASAGAPDLGSALAAAINKTVAGAVNKALADVTQSIAGGPPAASAPVVVVEKVAPPNKPVVAAAVAAPASAASAPIVRFTTRALPAARVGSNWRPPSVLEAGSPKSTLSLVAPAPAWIKIEPEGAIGGVPDAVGTVQFTVRAVPLAAPERAFEQSFKVSVLPALVVKLSAAQTQASPELPTADPRSWRLDAKDIEQLTNPETSPVEPKAVPTIDQLKGMLAPLKGLDYPSESLLRAALRLSRCSYFSHVVRDAGKAPPAGQPICPVIKAPARAASAPSLAKAVAVVAADGPVDTAPEPTDLTLPEFYEKLIPIDLEDAIVKQARKLYPQSKPIATNWSASKDCGCVPPARADEVYAFVNYWGSPAQQKAAAAAAAAAASAGGAASAALPPAERVIDFSLYSRLVVFGAVLNDLGDYELPSPIAVQAERLARAAQKHGTRLDLLVYRHDWSDLLQKPPAYLESYARQAAKNAIKLVDTQLGDAEPAQGWQGTLDAWQRKLLLWFWREEVYTFSGLTLYFDGAPVSGAAGAAYQKFFKTYVESLIAQLQQTRRSYRLNIVIPGDRTNDDGGVYKLQDLMGYIQLAEPRRTSKQVDAREKSAYKGTSDITLEYLVLLSDPTTDTKKVLRARIDQSEAVKGADRVAFLDSLVPVLLTPPVEKPPWARQDSGKQFDDDLAYMKWNYGGVTLWDPPDGTANADHSKLDHYFRADERNLPRLCDFVCVNRMPLRLLLQTLGLLGVASLALWVFSCEARQWIGRHWVALCLGGGGVTAALALAMLECDPSLEKVSRGNVPLIAVTVVFFLYLLYVALKPKDELR